MKSGTTIILVTAALLFTATRVAAQLPIPRFDVELKGQQTIFPGKGSKGSGVEVSEFTGYYAALHIQLNQFVGVGGFYAHSIRGAIHYSRNLPLDNSVRDADHLYTGLDLRVSTGRSSTWRPYLSLRYGKTEVVEQREGYNVGGKSSAVGASLGLMRRLGSKVYLTIIEAGATKLSDRLFWIDTGFAIEGKMGVLVNFGKKK